MHNQFRAACIFVAVILVSVVQAEALSSDERAALESQLAESRAENERLRGENGRLRVKINVLHAQLETADDEKIGARFLSEEMLDQDGAMSTKLKSSVNGNEVSTDLTQRQLEKMLAKVEYVGSGDVPKWKIIGGTFEARKGVPVSDDGQPIVTCPCREKGTALTSDQALRRILGQISAIGISKNICHIVIAGEGGPMRAHGGAYVQKVGVATTKMFQCWQHKCSVSAMSKENDFHELDNLLADSEHAEAAAGWDCG